MAVAPTPRSIVLAVLLAAACRRAGPLPQPAADFGIEAAPGEDAPAIELAGLDGARVSLQSLRGQVVFVNFWATWCPPCREEMPGMMALGRELAARHPGRFKMLAVSVDDGWDPVRSFFSGPPYQGSADPLLVALDVSDQTTTIAYYCAARAGCPGEYKFPESYIVDRHGKLVAYVVGPRDWSDPRARAYLEQLIE
ncbi:MAG TPA: TlpA disulfide reductase family protein [Anaeromyxobacter sp.]|nr:TlpA disulfide reductase family protein [Anaeromyxobacter sp.]